MTTNDLQSALASLPRVGLGHFPTPLDEARRLASVLGGPRIFIKRDDCTGLAMGGNKTRHNEFLLADALEQGAEMLVWGAGVQSNNCRQTAAGCARLGLGCHLVLTRVTHHDELQGNLLLDHLLGASYEIVDVPMGPQLEALILDRAERWRKAGRKVYAWDGHVVKAKAAASYILCLIEIEEQMARLGVVPAAIYVCSGGSTGAGLALARAAREITSPLRIILPIRWPWDEQEDLARIANETAQLLGIPVRLDAEDLDVSPDYVGPGYGIPTREGMDAVAMLARTEGILLDPSYTGKAMAALLDDVRQGRYSKHDSIVFIHTGGTPALFAYRDELASMVPGTAPLAGTTP